MTQLLAVDLADDVHHFRDAGRRAALVDDGQVATQLLGQRAGAHHAAHVGRDDDQVGVVLALQVRQQHRAGVDVVYRDVKEALDLVGMQVHRQHALDAHGFQQVGHHLGADGHPRAAWTGGPAGA